MHNFFQRFCVSYLQKSKPEIIELALKEKHLGLLKTRRALKRIVAALTNIIKTFSWDWPPHYNMSEELQQQLRAQLWNVANTLRGNMSAGDFMYFSLGFIFYKYLSEKIEKSVDAALVDDGITFKELWQSTDEDAEELKAEVRNQCMDSIGYFIEPEFLFSSIIASDRKSTRLNSSHPK